MSSSHVAVLLPRLGLDRTGLDSAAFARHYSRYHFCFLFLRVLRCFSSPGSPQSALVEGLQPSGLPHSGIRGSFRICRSPRLFAAYHALLRLREPRHPPCALRYFLLPRRIATDWDFALCSLQFTRFFHFTLPASRPARTPEGEGGQRRQRFVHYVNDLLFRLPGVLTDTRGTSFVENEGLEPSTPCVQGRCSKPTELIPRSTFSVVPGRVELPTSTLSVWRSNQLS